MLKFVEKSLGKPALYHMLYNIRVARKDVLGIYFMYIEWVPYQLSRTMLHSPEVHAPTRTDDNAGDNAWLQQVSGGHH